MWTLLIPLALAAVPEPDPIDVAFDLAIKGHPEQAMPLIAAELRAHPDNLVARRAWLWTGANRLAAGPELIEIARRDLQAAPEDPIRQITLAYAYNVAASSGGGEWCQEIDDYVPLQPVVDEQSYYAVRTRRELATACAWDEEPATAALKLGSDAGLYALTYSLMLRLRDHEPVDATVISQLERVLAEAPRHLSRWTALWSDEANGPALERARELVVARADELTASEHTVYLEAASSVLREAGRTDDADAIDARLAAKGATSQAPSLMWDGDRYMPMPPSAMTREGLTALGSVRSKAPEAELKALDKLADRFADAPGDLAAMHQRRAWLLTSLDRPEDAVAAHKSAWEARPVDAADANRYAWAAAEAGIDLADAEAAMHQALALPMERSPYGDPQSQRDRAASSRASWLDTLGWLQHLRGDDTAALETLRQAELLGPEPSKELLLHLALVAHALGDDPAALASLRRAFSGEQPPPDAPITSQGRTLLEDLFERTRWAPGGLAAWLAGPDDAPKGDDSGGSSAFDHWRVGQPLADLDIRIGGVDQRLSDTPGWRVVDIWATWCGPCVAGLPETNRIAKEYADRGVGVLAVSVDAEEKTALRFRKLPRPTAFTQAWAGEDGLRKAGVSAIPRIFVLDPEGIIRAVVEGYGGEDDTRITDALDALLEEG